MSPQPIKHIPVMLKKIAFELLVSLLVFLLSCNSTQAQSKELIALKSNDSDLSMIRDDYSAGRKFLGEYLNLVHRGVKEDNPALFEEAKVNLRRAQTLLGNAYTREKAYQGVDKQARFNPLTLREYRYQMKLAKNLESGKYIEMVIAQSKADGLKTLKFSDLKPAPPIGNIWEDGKASANSGNADYSQCVVGKWGGEDRNQYIIINGDGTYEWHYTSTNFPEVRGVTIGRWQIRGTTLSFGKTTFSYEKSNKYAKDLARASFEACQGILKPETNTLLYNTDRGQPIPLRGVNIDCKGNAILKGNSPAETEAIKNFQAASDDYSQGRYSSSLDKLAMAENQLGESNAAIEGLKARNHFRQGNIKEAEKALDNFKRYRSTRELIEEIKVLDNQIREAKYKDPLKGLDQQKKELEDLFTKRIEIVNTVKGRILRRIYRSQVDELNELIEKGQFTEALALFEEIQSNPYYDPNDIQALEVLQQYIAYQKAAQSHQSASYLNYLESYPNSPFDKEVKELLLEVLAKDADAAYQAKNYPESIRFYRAHQRIFPGVNEAEISKALGTVHFVYQNILMNTADNFMESKSYAQAITGYELYLEKYPQGTFKDRAEKGIKKAKTNKFEPYGSFWSITSKGGIGWSWDFGSRHSILGAGTGLMVNPLFFFSDLDKKWNVDNFDFANNTYERTGGVENSGYLFAIHFDLNYQVAPRFWAFAGVAYGYYDYYNEIDIISSSFSYDEGIAYLRDVDYAGWKVSPRVGAYFVIKPRLTLKYAAVIRMGVSHQIGISFAGPF